MYLDQSAGLSPVWPRVPTLQCREQGSRVVGRSSFAANEEFGLGGGAEAGPGGTFGRDWENGRSNFLELHYIIENG